MKLDTKALAAAGGILWGAAVLLVGLANLAQPQYGRDFLLMLRSIYPGYDAAGTIGSMVTGTLYALVDGAIGGLVFGWLYNFFAGGRGEKVPVEKTDRQTPVEP